MNPHIVDGISKLIASGNYPAAMVCFGIGAVMYFFGKGKD